MLIIWKWINYHHCNLTLTYLVSFPWYGDGMSTNKFLNWTLLSLSLYIYIYNSIIGWKIWTLNVSIRNTKKCQQIKLLVMLAFVIQNTRALLGVIFKKTWWIVLMLIFPSMCVCVCYPFSFFLENLNIRLGEEKKWKRITFIIVRLVWG